jgi:hypothetical protein
LTITAVNESMVYGGAFPTSFLTSYVGFVNGDTAASLTNLGTQTTTATAGSSVGTYPKHESGAYDPNYTITNVDGTFTVTPDSTLTALLTSASGAALGQPVTLSAGVAPQVSASATETGSVVFYDGSTPLAAVSLGSGGVVGAAAFTTSSLSPGVHTLTATYPGDANHTGSTSTPVTVTVGTPPASGAISGTVFRDYNTNGVEDTGEPRMGGQTLFLDLYGSGVLQPGDPTAITDANGNYQFIGLGAGTYTVRQLLLGGVLPSAPTNDSYQVTVTSGGSVTRQDFADVLTSIAVPLTLTPNTPFPAQGNANADYIEAVYRSVLNRNADPAGLANWTSLLSSGTLTRLQVVQGIRNSPEHFTQEVQAFYLTLLNRQADAAGLQNWVRQLENGMREEQMAFYFLNSPEYLGKGDKHFVDAMYLSLLGRTFDAAGEANWLNQLGDDTSGTATHAAALTHEQVITYFLYSTESLTRLTEGYYEVFLQRTADAAGLSGWVANLQQATPFLTIGQLFVASDEFYNRAVVQG